MTDIKIKDEPIEYEDLSLSPNYALIKSEPEDLDTDPDAFFDQLLNDDSFTDEVAKNYKTDIKKEKTDNELETAQKAVSSIENDATNKSLGKKRNYRIDSNRLNRRRSSSRDRELHRRSRLSKSGKRDDRSRSRSTDRNYRSSRALSLDLRKRDRSHSRQKRSRSRSYDRNRRRRSSSQDQDQDKCLYSRERPSTTTDHNKEFVTKKQKVTEFDSQSTTLASGAGHVLQLQPETTSNDSSILSNFSLPQPITVKTESDLIEATSLPSPILTEIKVKAEPVDQSDTEDIDYEAFFNDPAFFDEDDVEENVANQFLGIDGQIMPGFMKTGLTKHASTELNNLEGQKKELIWSVKRALDKIKAFKEKQFVPEFVYTPRIYKPNIHFDPNEDLYRSPLAFYKNPPLRFCSREPLNLKMYKFNELPKVLSNVGWILGFDASDIMSFLYYTLNDGMEVNEEPAYEYDGEYMYAYKSNQHIEEPSSDGIPEIKFDTNAIRNDFATQTDFSATEKKGFDMGVQTVHQVSSIASQTEDNDDDLPLFRIIKHLNPNKLMALNDFAEILDKSHMASTREQYSIRERLLDVYNMGYRREVTQTKSSEYQRSSPSPPPPAPHRSAYYPRSAENARISPHPAYRGHRAELSAAPRLYVEDRNSYGGPSTVRSYEQPPPIAKSAKKYGRGAKRF